MSQTVSYLKITRHIYLIVLYIQKHLQLLLADQWIEKVGKITNKKTKKYLCTETCIIPKYGEKSYITVETSGKVMSLKGGETKRGTEVILETKVAADKQLWTRSRPTSNGYFTFQSAATAG